ncbi:MAG: hypothetical protein U1E83_05535 [Methylotetracoccus sp.]
MTTIRITQLAGQSYSVAIDAGTPTTHVVTVDPEYARTLTGGTMSIEDLLRQSFEFLLEREPNTSILRSFDLPLIGRYFPEYERTIRARMHD